MKIATVILGALLCLPLHADIKSDAALDAAAEQLLAENQTETTVNAIDKEAFEKAAPAEAKTEELKESEIPVVISTKKAGETKDNTIWRLMASLGIIAVTAGLVLFASKRWGRAKDKGGQKARIEMMHQLHLGPRKSLALVRVSGEAMLIGITDSNINMIKAVALIDDELENVANKDFNSFLEDEFSVEDLRSAITPRA